MGVRAALAQRRTMGKRVCHHSRLIISEQIAGKWLPWRVQHHTNKDSIQPHANRRTPWGVLTWMRGLKTTQQQLLIRGSTGQPVVWPISKPMCPAWKVDRGCLDMCQTHTVMAITREGDTILAHNVTICHTAMTPFASSVQQKNELQKHFRPSLRKRV